MSPQSPGSMSRPVNYTGPDWRRGANLPAPPRPQGGGLPILPLLGLAALGVIVLGGLYVAPDIIRYMKIRNM